MDIFHSVTGIEFSVMYAVILFFTGMTAGFVDSIAGGGGLISIPVLLATGMPPHAVLGTNKLQASFGSFSASVNYLASGKVSLKKAGRGIFFSAAGAITGALTVQVLEASFIADIIPGLLILIFIYTVFNPAYGDGDHPPRLKLNVFFMVFGFTLGFYDGFFGPGTGSFWTAAFVVIMGFNLTKASGYTRLMNFTSNFASLVFFIIGGNVLYKAGLIMAAGQIIGAKTGSGMAIRRGAGFIRPVFLFIVFVTMMKTAFDAWG